MICTSLENGLSICTIARGDLALDRSMVEQRLAGKRVHARHQRRQIALDDEILALLLERLTGAGAPARARGSTTCRQLLLVRSGFCSEPDSANSFPMIRCVSMNHECRSRSS